MTNLTKKNWIQMVIGGIVSFFIFRLLNNLPSVINWILQNAAAIGIIALVVYMIKKE